jgi:hypothetical protein
MTAKRKQNKQTKRNLQPFHLDLEDWRNLELESG